MVVSVLLGLFIFLAFVLGVFVMMQPGKGDMGLGALHSSGQALFGGSGGQTFFEKLTWVLGVIFMLGALTLTVLHMKELDTTRISMPQKQVAQAPTLPTMPAPPTSAGN